MIAVLNGQTLDVARQTARKFLVSTEPTIDRSTLDPELIALGLERERAMRIGTRAAANALEVMLLDFRARLFGAVPMLKDGDDAGGSLREAAGDQILNLDDQLAGIPGDYMLKALSPTVDDLVTSASESVKAELKLSFSVKPLDAIDALYHRELEFSKNFTDREKVALKSLILDSLDQGTSNEELARNIRREFSKGIHYVDANGKLTRTIPDVAWCEMVARTECSRAYNLGTIASYRKMGVTKVRWNCASDEFSCDVCRSLDGKVAEIDNDFPGFPGIAMPPDPHPNCRCALTSA